MDKYSIFHTETLEKHYKILYNIVPANSGERRKLQKKLELKYGVIQTPNLLYEKHIITEFNWHTALNLSLSRFQDPDFQPGRYLKVNTVFEDPENFYEYPEFNFIISKEPVKVYEVKQTNNNRSPIVRSLGRQWAIFNCEPNYHFDHLVYERL